MSDKVLLIVSVILGLIFPIIGSNISYYEQEFKENFWASRIIDTLICLSVTITVVLLTLRFM